MRDEGGGRRRETRGERWGTVRGRRLESAAMAGELRTNLLYFGDNLGWLRDFGAFPDESVDLVYLDPPFNSNRNYNVLFKESDVRESEAQIHAFEDTWSWDREGDVQETYNDFWLTAPEKPKQMLKAMVAALGHNDVTAYLTMMAPRLVELHRVLKPTGSLYLHCDPTASHYLKIMLDATFGPSMFRNEIIWRRTGAHGKTRRYGPIHDSILFYTKTRAYTWTAPKKPYMLGHVKENFVEDANGFRTNYYGNVLTGSGTRNGESGKPWRGFDPTAKGRHWAIPGAIVEDSGEDLTGLTQHQKLDRLFELGFIREVPGQAWPIYQHYIKEHDGQAVPDIWAFQPYTGGTVFGTEAGIDEDVRWLSTKDQERLGYPTQKPLALLERIVGASSNEGDVVLDPFCGCGTAVHAAQKLGRRWIGIDITPLATDLIRRRMEDAFPGLKVPIEGWPVDMAGAVALAALADKYHFQDWAVIQAGGRPAGGERKKGADKGVDGVIPFVDGIGGKGSPKRGIISVKAGNTGPAHVRDLAGVVASDADAAFGVFICLHAPTKPMTEAALEAGTWVSDYDGVIYPRLQILSAQDLIEGRQVKMPQAARTALFAEAGREKKRGQQGRLV